MDTVMRTSVMFHNNLMIDYEREHNINGDYIHDPANYAQVHHFIVVPLNPEPTIEDKDD